MTTCRVGDVRITTVPQMTWTIPFVGFVPDATAAASAGHLDAAARPWTPAALRAGA